MRVDSRTALSREPCGEPSTSATAVVGSKTGPRGVDLNPPPLRVTAAAAARLCSDRSKEDASDEPYSECVGLV